MNLLRDIFISRIYAALTGGSRVRARALRKRVKVAACCGLTLASVSDTISLPFARPACVAPSQAHAHKGYWFLGDRFGRHLS